jgi:predicted HAD superfamily Cof-like phosphohydrolase
MKIQDQVTEFQRAFGQPVGDTRTPGFQRPALRMDLISEEYCELDNAIEELDFPAAVDALGDMIYVIVGTAVEWGVDIGAILDEIHRTNMAKAGGPRRADGKILKPPGWKPPDIVGCLKRQR